MREPLSKWNWRSLLIFEVMVCAVSLFFSIVASSARQIVVTVPARGGVSIGSNTILLLLGSFLPGAALLLMSSECRAATFRLDASAAVYLNAVLIGFALPFSSYLGAKVSYLPWNSTTLSSLTRVFAINLPLSPLWEEIIWRGYFFPKVKSVMRTGPSIVVASLGWTIWHVGFLFQLEHLGIPAAIMAITVAQIFLGGIVLCSFFGLGHNSLFPCVLLHTAFNASTAIYFGSFNRANDIGSYVAETFFTAVAAIIAYRLAIGRARGVEVR